MSHKAKSANVGGNGEEIVLCFSVEEGTGTSGTKGQFVDVKVSAEQAEVIRQQLSYQLDQDDDED